MTLGEKIRECRTRAGLSQEQLAERMDVTRQAVGKWESGQSAPGAEKLQRLADLFGESLTPPAGAKEGPQGAEDTAAGKSPGEAEAAAAGISSGVKTDAFAARELFTLAARENAEKAAARGRARRQNALRFLSFCAAYLLLYLLGRLIWCGGPEVSAAGLLFTAQPSGEHSYLFGWLLSSGLFWWAAAVSALPALFGKWKFPLVTLAGFVLGFLLGLVLGPNPAGAALGQGHYGWAIWGAVFLLSCAAGGLAQRFWRRR